MPRRVGVIGSFVWDEIHGRDPRDTPVQEWGGITYALSALDAALSPDWEIVPLLKVGSDMASRAREFLSSLRRIAADAAPIEVPYPNNRVVLRYTSAEQRCEQLTGGVTQAGDALFEPLRSEVRRRAFKTAVDACEIVPGMLPISAGVVGAVATFKAQTFGKV